MTKNGRLADADLPSFLSKTEKNREYTSDILTKSTKYNMIKYNKHKTSDVYETVTASNENTQKEEKICRLKQLH